VQSTYGGYVYSYAVKSIANLNKTEGAYLNALFWVCSFALSSKQSFTLMHFSSLSTHATSIFIELSYRDVGFCLDKCAVVEHTS